PCRLCGPGEAFATHDQSVRLALAGASVVRRTTWGLLPWRSVFQRKPSERIPRRPVAKLHSPADGRQDVGARRLSKLFWTLSSQADPAEAPGMPGRTKLDRGLSWETGTCGCA